MSDGAADRSRVLELVLKHMYAKVGICEERVLVGSNPPTRITHVFHARLKGPMIPCRAVRVLKGVGSMLRMTNYQCHHLCHRLLSLPAS